MHTSLTPRARAGRYLGIAVLLGSTALALVWAAQGFKASQVSPQQIADQFERNAGFQPGFRRNHSKGLCMTGYFEAQGDASAYSKAALFRAGRTPVIGRFAIGGSNPKAADDSVPIRSLALQFNLANGEQWRTAMNSNAVFAVATPQGFYEQLQASQPDPKTGKPDPARVKAFFDSHPETAAFRAWMKGFAPSSSWANTHYYGLNAFILVQEQGQRQAVRWSLVPEQPYEPLAAAQRDNPNALSHDLEQRLQQGPLRWQLRLTLAQPEDPTHDATRVWPADRAQITAGVVVLEHSQPQATGPCRDINYDPLVLPAGIEGSDDPLLSARSAVYAATHYRRLQENHRTTGALQHE